MSDTPEAPASMNVRFSSTLGYEYLLTIRSFAEEKPGGELLKLIPDVETTLQNLGCKPVFGKNTQPQTTAPQEKAKEKPKKKPCPIHEGEFLYLRTNKETGQSWYSHQPDGSDEWCRGE